MSTPSGTYKTVNVKFLIPVALSDRSDGSRDTEQAEVWTLAVEDGTTFTVDAGTNPNQWTRMRPQSGPLPPPATASAIHCHGPHRRAGVSTQHLRLVPRGDVERLPYAIRRMRDCCSLLQPNAISDATDQLQLIATLRNSLCYMPPVFGVRAEGLWGTVLQRSVFDPLSMRWPCTYMLLGLTELAATIPDHQPDYIDFTRIPQELVEVYSHTGERIDTNQWHAGTRCIAAYCLQIIRAMPGHS